MSNHGLVVCVLRVLSGIREDAFVQINRCLILGNHGILVGTVVQASDFVEVLLRNGSCLMQRCNRFLLQVLFACRTGHRCIDLDTGIFDLLDRGWITGHHELFGVDNHGEFTFLMKNG